jgi:RNA polymerase sigma-70 factor, ECF subfamily
MTRQATETTDVRLMEAVRDGDIRQLNVLFARHDRRLYNFFVRTTGSRDAAEDLTQEVFMRILRYRETFRAGKSFLAWMYQIARNVGADYRAHPRLEQGVEAGRLEAIGPATAPVDAVGAQERELLGKALGQLSPEKREAVVLSCLEGLKSAEVGEILGCTATTARVRVFRAIEELRGIVFEMTGEATLWNAHK